MKKIIYGSLVFMALSFTAVAQVNPNAYLGKDPSQMKGEPQGPRKPMNIFINGSDNSKDEEKSNFWLKYPNFNSAGNSVDNAFGNDPMSNQPAGFGDIFSGFNSPMGMGQPEMDNPYVVQGLDLAVDVKLRDAAKVSTEYKVGKLISYVESQNGWVNYGSVNTRFSEYVPFDRSDLAEFTEANFRAILIDSAKERFSFVNTPSFKNINFKEKNYNIGENSPIVVKDVCAKSKENSQNIISRVWMTKENKIIKFVIFESDACLIK